MRRLLKDIGAEQVGATVINEDNQGAIPLAKNVFDAEQRWSQARDIELSGGLQLHFAV
ncbi:hypothetical protein PF003_g20337 [Phytophthora fragariae]|nr:hypothetical protein PF003_g20337 [Phytophthora fragariae]